MVKLFRKFKETAIVFLLWQLLLTIRNNQGNGYVSFLNELGLTRELDLEQVADHLRHLIVNEWQGPNMHEYKQFLVGEFIEAAKDLGIQAHSQQVLGIACLWQCPTLFACRY